MPSHGSTTDRGYGYAHQCKRARWVRRQKAGETLFCWRCKKPILPGERWDLGHHDHNRDITMGPEHALKKDCPAGGNRAIPRRKPASTDPDPDPPAALSFFD